MTTFYRIGGGTATWYTSGKWSNTSGGSSNGTYPDVNGFKDVVIDSNSGSPTISLDDFTFDGGGYPPNCASLNTTGSNCTFTNGTLGRLLVGGNVNVTNSTWGTNTQVAPAGAGATLTTSGVALRTVDIGGTSTTLNDDLSCENVYVDDSATFSANTHNVTVSNRVAVSGTLSMGSGTWTLTGDGFASGSMWSSSYGSAVVNGDTSTLKFTSNASTARLFDAAGHTFNNVWFATAGTGAIQITGSNTFNNFKVNAGQTIKFSNGTTTTVSTVTATGSAGNLISLIPYSGSYTLTKSGGGTISCDYLSINHSTATPAATWYAGANSTDGGSNSGWIFASPPSPPSGFFSFF